jgi:hypothetical protein
MLALIPTHSISLEDRLGEPPKNRQAMPHRNYIFDRNVKTNLFSLSSFNSEASMGSGFSEF